jgi:hypothetical protein
LVNNWRVGVFYVVTGIRATADCTSRFAARSSRLLRLAGDVDVHVVAEREQQRDHSRLFSMRFDVGEVVDDRYAIESLLGDGGIGQTYRALDRLSGQTVALKIPHISVIGDLGAYGRYQREVDTGARLEYPVSNGSFW